MDELVAILLGAAGSALFAILLWLFSRTRIAARIFGSSFRLARRLDQQGMTRFNFSRDDYRRTLSTYLSQAQRSISIVSVSLKVTHSAGDFVGLFEERLASNPDFRIAVSLLNPGSAAAGLAAQSLKIPLAELQREISEMLGELADLRDGLQHEERHRLRVLTHDSFPMGSAIMLDASPDQGIIQVETKLYRSPRDQSFGFEVTGPSEFFMRNYRAWMRVIEESADWSPGESV